MVDFSYCPSYLGEHGFPSARWSVHEHIAVDPTVPLRVDGGPGEGAKVGLKLGLEWGGESGTQSWAGEGRGSHLQYADK